MPKLVVHKRASRYLKRIDARIKSQVIAKLEELARNPDEMAGIKLARSGDIPVADPPLRRRRAHFWQGGGNDVPTRGKFGAARERGSATGMSPLLARPTPRDISQAAVCTPFNHTLSPSQTHSP